MRNENVQSGDPVQYQHNATPRTVFRPDAVRRYTQQQATIVLPRQVAMRTIVTVWIALGLLIVATAAIWMARVPIYLSGDAIVVDQGSPAHHKLVLVAFLPPTARAQVGQSLLVQLEASGTYSYHTIIDVEPEVMSPDVAQRRYAPGSDQLITRPAAVVTAPFIPAEDAPAVRAGDEHYRVKVVIGTRRLISFLPFFRHRFPEQPS